MLGQSTCDQDNTSQVYGFLCQKTNVFYAFQSYETYQEFLLWFETQAPNQNDQIQVQEYQQTLQVPDEACQLADFELATRQIMGVFNDPVFCSMEQESVMKQIDF